MPRRPKYVTDSATFNAEFERIVKLRAELNQRLKEANDLISSLEEHSELPSEVEQHLGELKQEAANLNTLLTSSQTYADSIETYYNTWSETKGKIDAQLKEAVGQNKTLKDYTKEAAQLKDDLTTELKRSGDLLDDARETLEIVTNSALSSVFNKRANDRKKARRWWLGGVVLAIIIFVCAVLFTILVVAKEVQNEASLSVWVIKLALITPFAYILFFVTRQYSHERDLEEKYAFKSLVSQTIQNNTKLLRDEFLNDTPDKDVELKVVDFVVESLKNIYKEPFSKASMQSSIKFNPKKPSVEAKASQSEQN